MCLLCTYEFSIYLWVPAYQWGSFTWYLWVTYYLPTGYLQSTFWVSLYLWGECLLSSKCVYLHSCGVPFHVTYGSPTVTYGSPICLWTGYIQVTYFPT